MAIRVFHKQFKPSIWVTILALFAFLMLLKLGFWQLQRANEKRSIEQAIAMRPTLPALKAEDLPTLSQDEWAFRRVKITGFFDNEHQFLLDNQHFEHRIGFRVLTPFRDNKGVVMLVDRGFIPRNNANTTPTLRPIQGIQTIEAQIEAPIKKNFTLGVVQQTKNWPMVIEAIDFSLIEKQLQQRVFPVVLQLEASNQFSFVQSKPVVQVSHQRHVAYAVQWFLLAAALLIVFVIANLKKVENQ